MRHHGLEKPYNWMQVSTWIILPTLILHFFFFVSPILTLEASIPCSVVFFISAMICTYKGYKTCITDPVDDNVRCHLAKKEKGSGYLDEEEPVDNNNEELKYCFACETNVKPHAMHCKFCDKCVGRFDHHCQWLNTCIGEKNYQYFFQTVVSTFLFVLCSWGCLTAVIILYFIGWGDGKTSGTEQRARDWFGADQPNIVMGINCFFWAFDTVAEGLILQLLFFHLQLRKEGLTTYQYIVRDNEKKRMEARTEIQIKSRRANHIKKAKQEGNTTEVIKLVVGGWKGCSCIDPIRKEMKEEDEAAKVAASSAAARPSELENVNDDDSSDDEAKDGTTNGYDGSNGVSPALTSDTSENSH